MIDDIGARALRPESSRLTGQATPGIRRRTGWRERFTKPALLDIRFGQLLNIYAWRLRHHGLQELLAGIGIAIGVALLFGVLISSQSITGSGSAILHAITGKARFQIAARSPEGFDERLAERMGELPGVRVAAPVLRANAVLVGPGGRRSIQLVGSTVSQLALEGAATRYLGSERPGNGLALTSSLAKQLAASVNGSISLLARGHRGQLAVHAIWGSQQVGALANAAIAVGTLSTAQRVLALPGRVTQVFIVPESGRQAKVRAELEHLAEGRLDVQPADHELTVLDAAAAPATQSATLFAAIGGIVGFLFAVNAMLLTVPERRRWVAEARTQGYSAGQVIVILGFQALALGLIASGFGLLVGYALARALFTAVPGYLTLSFPIGSSPVVTAPTIVLAFGAGLLATLVASAAPLRDLSSRRPIDAVLHGSGKVGHSINTPTMLLSGIVGAAAIVAGGLVALSAPSASIASTVLLAVGALSFVPVLLVVAIRGLMPTSERMPNSMLAVALSEVEGTATRSIALAGVAALAVYGSVAILGAREDLIRGLNAAVAQYLDTADLWVSPAGNNPFQTDSFSAPGAQAMIASVPGVASVRSYQGSFLDIGSRRLWIRARPAGDRRLIQSSQLLQGNLVRASGLVRAGGWATISNSLASARHLAVGDDFTLPTPAGAMTLRVAAITTNTGWPPGAITMNASDYRHYWQTSDPTALEVSLRPGVSPTSARREVAHALSGWQGLHVQTRAEREAQYENDAKQGVQSLSEISTLVLIAAALAVTFALFATIAARRVDLASRKAEGYEPGQLQRMLLLESAVVVGVGALDGAALGVLAHALTSRWLRLSQGFAAPFSFDGQQLLLTLGIIAGVTLAVTALVGYLAARVPPRLSLQE
jgi:putative ABC transport system permease protein